MKWNVKLIMFHERNLKYIFFYMWKQEWSSENEMKYFSYGYFIFDYNL